MMILLYGSHGYFRCLFGGKVEFPSREAVKGDACNAFFIGQLQAGLIAGNKKFFMLQGQRAIYIGAYGVDYIRSRQIIGPSNFGPACRFRISLRFHYVRAFQSELNACKSMDGVINTAVTRKVAAGHAAVGGIDNGIRPQSGYIALPQKYPVLHRSESRYVYDAFPFHFFFQKGILYV